MFHDLGPCTDSIATGDGRHNPIVQVHDKRSCLYTSKYFHLLARTDEHEGYLTAFQRLPRGRPC
jgi:hypothetical protein